MMTATRGVGGVGFIENFLLSQIARNPLPAVAVLCEALRGTEPRTIVSGPYFRRLFSSLSTASMKASVVRNG